MLSRVAATPSSSSMLSTIPPPRPVSVNSLTREPFPTPLTLKKSTRCASTEVPIHDSSDDAQTHSDPGDGHFGEDEVMDDQSQGPLIEDEPLRCSLSDLDFERLPVEIHEAILDYLFGERASTVITSLSAKPSSRSRVKSLHHPRRKALSNLALISPVWRPLVQDRIYRHIKVKGTSEELAECAKWFHTHPHLVPYVRHVEIWVPVWGPRTVKNHSTFSPTRRYLNEDFDIADVASMLHTTVVGWEETDAVLGSTFNYQLPSQKATLQEIFHHVKTTFPDVRILTLEGGHCKKPPMIPHFKTDPWGHTGKQRLDVLPSVQTFVMRGSWNIMREYQHWRTLAEALPSLREWQCAYAKPKAEAYNTIGQILSNWTLGLQHVNISLDGFFSKDLSEPHMFFGESCTHDHLCWLLGQVAPRLESLAFTGKVCSYLFDSIRSLTATKSVECRLQSLDLVVKSCCRHENRDPLSLILDDASGITNLKFIKSFEELVHGAVSSLENLPTVEYVRIRFIDLDSACSLLNPYFQLVDNQCTGLWSVGILETLQKVRPNTHFIELADGIYPQYGLNNTIVGAIYPRNRPLSINANMYKIIADASKA